MLKTLFLVAALAFTLVAAFVAPVGGPLFARIVAAQGAAAIIPLEGLDPVLLIQGKEAQGDEKFSVTRGRFRYLFAGVETMAAFEREPARYEIQLGGTCARMGPSTQGNPDLYAVHDGRIYLFGSPACVKAFREAPDKYLETAGAWAATAAAPTDDARRKGRSLVERAVEAVGGAARLDALVSYQEKATTSARTPQGVTEIKTSLTRVFPGKYREERALSFGTIATVVTPAGGFYSTARGGADLLDEQRAAYEKQFARNVLSLLREWMSELESRLDPDKFLRIHRSTIVNLDRVREMHPRPGGEYAVVLHDGTELKLSRRGREQLQKLLNLGGE